MRRSFASVSGVLLAVSVLYSSSATGVDLDTGNAPIEVIIPAVAPIIFTDVSPSGSDATLVLRVTTLVTNAWFDASAPYHATAQGIYSRRAEASGRGGDQSQHQRRHAVCNVPRVE